MKRLPFVLFCAILVCACYAQEYLGMAQRFVEEQVSKESGVQVDSLQAKAEAGDVEAARRLSAYYLSRGKDEAASAFRWAVHAAEGGDAMGAMNAGICCYAGVGTAQDDALAAEWFEKAVRLGCDRALNPLSYLYAEGRGVKQDLTKALQLAELACQREVPFADERLAEFYFKGQGVPQDLDKAESILKQHLEKFPGDGSAANFLAGVIQAGDAGRQRRHEVVDWLKKAADWGEPAAMASLAQAYFDGAVVEKDDAMAAAYTQKAAAAGVPGALGSLALFYFQGTGVPKDVEKAISLCRQAMAEEPDSALAYRNLAGILSESAQSDAQWAEVEQLLLKAAELNDAEVMLELALEYSSDDDMFRENVPAAIHWCERALQAYPDAADLHCLLADNLLKAGDDAGTQERAYTHYAAAAAQCYPRAVRMLARAWAEGWAYKQGERQPANPEMAAVLEATARELEK